MSKLVINGGNKVEGELLVQGSKNAALPILAATVLVKGESIIHNCPHLLDINAAIKILEHLGCTVKREGQTIIVNSLGVNNYAIPDDLMREMRSSIIFLGSILARTKMAKLCSPGGCELGPRPIDIHISALKQLGAEINEQHGSLNCKVNGFLTGNEIFLPIPSVGATENAVIAASVASGKTIIHNAAREPEIINLIDFLNKAGAKIYYNNGYIEIEGVNELKGTTHTVIPDRIVASTYMSCAAITGGELLLKNTNTSHLLPVLDVFKTAGCNIKAESNMLYINAPKRLNSVDTIKTHYYPGFPTDAAPTTLAMLSLAFGTSVFVENIFENRFKYVDELKRMGAKINVEGRVAIVTGANKLWGSNVRCTDLRGGAALVVAASKANGVTNIEELHHIDRGYENIEKNLLQIGIDIKRKSYGS